MNAVSKAIEAWRQFHRPVGHSFAVAEIKTLGADRWREIKAARVANCGNCLFHCYYEAQNPDLLGDIPTGAVTVLSRVARQEPPQVGRCAVGFLKRNYKDVTWELDWKR